MKLGTGINGFHFIIGKMLGREILLKRGVITRKIFICDKIKYLLIISYGCRISIFLWGVNKKGPSLKTVLFVIMFSGNYPISIPFSTLLSSGVTKDNFPSGFVVNNNIP